MAELLDWQRDDPRLVVQRAVQELAAGKLVVFPTDTGYQFAATKTQQGLATLSQICPIKDIAAAVLRVADVPWINTTARRLGRRLWPGPVSLAIGFPLGDPALADIGWTTLSVTAPVHEAIRETIRQLGSVLFLNASLQQFASTQEMAAALPDSVALVIDDGPLGGFFLPTVIEIKGDTWAVTQSGSITAEMVQALMATTVLFVCTGNTCRSPMAEAICKKLLADRIGCRPEELPVKGFQVLSAGMAAMMGMQASPDAVVAVRELGADLSAHRSRPISADLLARTDYLFTMTENHLRALQPFCEEFEVQPQLLASDGQDVFDPIGAEAQVYRDCARQIFDLLQERLPSIKPC